VFERIIVTLDGSASSEAALPAAEEIARRLGSSLVLLHVIEAKPPKAIHGERHLATVDEAEAYLEPIVARLRAEGLVASAHVHVHDPGAKDPGDTREVAASVAAHVAEFGNDLAVMAAHGKHGLSEALSGSLPLRVAASGGAAVLLVPRPATDSSRGRSGEATAVSAPPAFAPRRLLVPLDGRSEHEVALPAAVTLASAFGLDLRLVAVVPRNAADAGGSGIAFARIAPALSGASLEYAVEGEERYLAEVALRLGEKGVKSDWRVIRGRPIKAIVAAAEEGDLIVLSSHRRIGLDASLDGCVAFGVAQAWQGAMLMAPVPRIYDF
jgi:nucleotide-binding universal stress UspA family protein